MERSLSPQPSLLPRRYERLADAGPATGVIDPLLVRAYLRAGTALPAHEESDGTPHSGAALHLFATGVARRVVKADVASLYPSLMRTYRIGPARDHLGALLALVDRLVEQRLAAKASARAAPNGSPERHAHEAMSAAMKLVVNSAYGYLAAGGGLTRFADVHAANEVTRRGRETLDLMCRALADRGVTLLEADTDGVYFAVPESWTQADERRVVSEVASLLPSLVQLELGPVESGPEQRIAEFIGVRRIEIHVISAIREMLALVAQKAVGVVLQHQ